MTIVLNESPLLSPWVALLLPPAGACPLGSTSLMIFCPKYFARLATRHTTLESEFC